MEAPCSELASALGFQEKKAEELQETLQRVLDRREEERQSKELLQLYLKAVENEDRQQGATSPSSQNSKAICSYCFFKMYFYSAYMEKVIWNCILVSLRKVV